MIISRKYHFYVFNFLVAFPMTVVMAFGNIVIAEGFQDHFWDHWINGTVISLSISYPATLIIVPIATKIINKVKWTEK